MRSAKLAWHTSSVSVMRVGAPSKLPTTTVAYSGGSMERPGLKQLLADVKAHKIDIVLVYKVDRLTRSLADFAKIVEVFDACDVSFVSVTQQFNTTSSMGRLTLNVLLSFAQFEREVTGERIATRLRPRNARACGWAVQSRWVMTSRTNTWL